MKNSYYLVITFLTIFFSGSAQADILKTVKISDDIYALVGETNARTADNMVLNNNLGFVVTDEAVVLIDSGTIPEATQYIESQIAKVTDKPVKWVINTGSQDHRWMGNQNFIDKGAEVIALKRTVQEQKKHVENHLSRLRAAMGDKVDGIQPAHATRVIEDDKAVLNLGGKTVELRFLDDSHFPGDAVVWLPEDKVIFTGDLVYVDRMLGITPYSSVLSLQKAFKKMAELQPQVIVPGHGSVCDMDKAQRQTGDYLDFLVSGVSAALEEWLELDETVEMLAEKGSQFQELQHFDSWHRLNVNRTYLQLEAIQ